MDNSDIYRVASLRRSRNGSKNSSGLWRNTAEEVFSRSARDEDDEEALKWASLERLPTYDRIRKGILSGLDGELKEIDIKNLGTQESKNLVERLIRVTEEDNERFLLKLKDRMDRVGIENPTIEVRFEHLNITAEAYIGSRALPTVFNVSINVIEAILNTLRILPSRKTKLSILNDVSGVLKPGRMTLLLGPPGSGKTTLLLALSGKLGSDLEVSGKITYNGHEMHEFVPRRTSAYISQNDLHIGEMTVRETLAFSARCQGVGTRYDMLAELSRREVAENIKPDPDIDVYMKASALEGQKENVVTEYILKILGLDICADTMVGDEMIRGISGGQRKRVTTGEMLVGPAKALFMDEISTGLDSSTTFQIVNSLRQSVHILGGTALIALLQPAPETYDLFDDILLLSDGHIVYQGPRENVLEFFESMGFKCPERKGVADFLQEVTSRKDQQQYWSRKDEAYYYISVQEFADAFQSFHVGRKVGEELSTPFDKKKSHPAALTTTQFGISKKELLKACLDREWLLMQRNSFVYYFKMMQLIIVAFITMTLFLRTEMKRNTVDDGGVFMGAMFFALVTILFNGFSELSMTIAKLPVFYKQRDLLFYPSWAYSFPTWLLKIPISLSEVLLWVGMTYYVIGYDPNVERLLRHYFLLLLIDQMAAGLFRVVAGVSREMVIANTLGSFVLLVVLSLGGYIMSRVDIKKWWIWGYWSSPLTYGQNAIAVNEFLGHSWSHILPGQNKTLGVLVLESRGVFTSSNWYWIGARALVGYVVLFNIIFTLSLAYLNIGTSQAVLSEEALKEKHANRTGEIEGVELSSKGKRSLKQSNNSGNEITPSSVHSGSAITDTSGEGSQSKKGMVLPFTPHSITFEDIKYSVDMPVEMKVQGIEEDRLMLLKGISGAFRPGVLTALMGVSGADKYPLSELNVTVYESLVYSAWLRLPPEVDSATRKMFIEEVMELVELKSLRGALVGLPGVNGLSTEQRKRLTIAVELVANPSIIFMDEPTSGLDARAAAIVMRTVRNTVDTGRTVVCTIHQPSIDIFEAFDELFLMKRGGEEIYVGPLGRNSCHLIKYFESVNGVPKIRDGYNPATWMLEVTTAAQEETIGASFVEIYKNSDLSRRNRLLIKELSTPPPGSKDLFFSTQYSQGVIIQCVACLWKQHLSYWRDPAYTAVRIFFTAVVALMFGSIFWKQGSTTFRRQDLFNAMGSMYAAVLFIGIQNASAVQPVVAVERTVFYRERAAGMYSALPYAFAQVAIEIPHVFLQTLIYGVVVYAMIDFQWTAAKFLWYLFYMYFTFLYFTYYGMMAVGLTPNQAFAAIVSAAFYSVWNLFAGFVITRPRIPVWWRWYYWACPVAWTLYGLGASQFGDIETNMESGIRVNVFLNDYFGYDYDNLGWISAGMIGFTVLFASVFALSIKMFNFQTR
ncbi:hypothetical protein IFM89_033094 [Coptis chinensis]|uniref:ABC transporter domain-containing protein n=1 Tax=Coptis chinensis TaxID=261450 RepID=A0A835IH25_9MAGN|nr:hypothetical protein IFM89_033094 [Coptis chinensis]